MRIEVLTILNNAVVIKNEEKGIKQQELHEIIYDYTDQNKNS